jgi:hypothetical protein
MDDLHHGSKVALLLEIPGIDAYEVEELVGIYQVKIPRKGQVTGGDSIPLDKGMAEFDFVSALGAITEMAEEQLAQKRDMAFHKAGMPGNIGLILLELIDLAHDL